MDTPRVALVTGAAKRVGRAIAERLAGAGFDVAFTYLNSESDARDVADHIRRVGRLALPIRADLLKSEESAAQIADTFGRTFDRLDVLVNNASLYEPSSLRSATPEQMQNLWAIHFQTPLLLCRRFEGLLRQSRGHIINMVDLIAERPYPEYLVYGATKAALQHLTLGLARELAPEVTVNGIAPGVVAFPDDLPQEDREKYLKRVPLGRPGTPADVAELVHFLATGGTYITGQIIRLDGGRSIT